MEGFERFLDTILSLDDVWFVTSYQAIQWMRNLSDPKDPLNFEPFQCNDKKVRLIALKLEFYCGAKVFFANFSEEGQILHEASGLQSLA